EAGRRGSSRSTERRARPPSWRPRSGSADDPDVLCLQAFRSPLHLELDDLTFRETSEAIGDDRAVVAEHILATFLLDESKSLRIVEPLHSTSCHFSHPDDQAASPLNNARANLHRQADLYPTWSRKSLVIHLR